MKKILLYLWQLPQNLLGLAVILFSRAKKTAWYDDVYFTKMRFGVSLGNYIIVNILDTDSTIRHETGHRKQSQYLGWLYLLVIGLPSILGNIWDRLFHKHWDLYKRITWYYKQPWEAWADKLGNVNR